MKQYILCKSLAEYAALNESVSADKNYHFPEVQARYGTVTYAETSPSVVYYDVHEKWYAEPPLDADGNAIEVQEGYLFPMTDLMQTTMRIVGKTFVDEAGNFIFRS